MAIKASATITLSAVRDLQSCTRYYLLQSSTSAKPAKPTANPPGGSWVTAEPSYTAGSTNSLYFCDLNVFSDSTFAYSDVSLSSSYEAAKAAYNKAVTAQATAEQALSNTEVVVGTQTKATSRWTGVASFAQLRDGQQIVYWLPYAYSSGDYVPYQPAGGSSANGTGLNLTLADGTQTGFIPCFYGGESRITSHYGAGSAVRLLYRENVVLGGHTYAAGWWADANYDSNTYDRIRFNNAIRAKTAIAASRLIVADAGGFFHLAAGSIFDVDKPILWAGSAIAAAATGTNNYLSISGCTLRNNAGSSWVAAQYATLYLAGTLNGNVFEVAGENWLTTAPASESLTYISLGYMYSTYQMYLYPEHPMYRLVNGTLTAISQLAYEAQIAATTAQAAAEGAVAQEQLIYISKAAGTASVAAVTTWVTTAADTQNAWSRKRPTYNSAYPVLFTATQRKTVGGAVSCTTPLKDDTTTVIDGGHITTGTIDASRVTVTNLNADNITTGTLDASKVNVTNLKAGNIKTGTISDGSGSGANSWNLSTGELTTKTGTIGAFTLANGVLSYTDESDALKPSMSLSGTELNVSALDPLLTDIRRGLRISNGVIGFYSNDTLRGTLFYNPQNGGMLRLLYNGDTVLHMGFGGNVFHGTADEAVSDSSGNRIENTYLKTSGGTMNGNLNMGQSTATGTARSILWTTEDGTVFRIRPYGNVFQLTRAENGGTEVSVLTVNSDGTITIRNAPGWLNALGVLHTSVTAVTNSSGNITINLVSTRYMIVGAFEALNSYIAQPFVADSDSKWRIKVLDANNTPITQTQVTIKLAYIDFGANGLN